MSDQLRFAWITDPHLNFLEPHDLARFFAEMREQAAEFDGFLVTGDIGEAPSVVELLKQWDDRVGKPTYFVLGNHDFYFGSIAEVRTQVDRLCAARPGLHYLTHRGVIEVGRQTALVGHDGWADARSGDYERSYVMMNDYRLIAELAGVGKRERWPLLKEMGDQAADHLRRVLGDAVSRFDNVWVATHVPPLREACWHEGQISDDEWAPHFTCLAVGDVLLQTADAHPHCRLEVFCGHTHGEGVTQPRPNLTIHTGGAVYGSPRIDRVIAAPD